jgi:hypothetical protein
MNTYNASVYSPQHNASLTISAPSAIDAAKNLWIAIHGSAIGFNFAQNNQHSECATARDNAHPQWLGGHAGIIVTRAESVQSDSDARLIAASPTLLSACQSALDLLTDPEAEAKDADKVTAILLAAITAATL